MNTKAEHKPWHSWWSDPTSHIGVKIVLGVAAGIIGSLLVTLR